MAVRYAGEVEIRAHFTGKVYRVRFKSTDGRAGSGTLTPAECRLSQKESRTSPEAYDKVAKRVLAFLRLKGFRVADADLRRVFQAPCPISVK